MKHWTAYLTLVLLLALSAPGLACPMCKDSITETAASTYGAPGSQAGLPGGFNFSIYFMLLSVFSMMALVIGVIAKGIRSSSATARRGFEPIKPK